MWLSHSHMTAFYWSHAGQHFEIRDEGDWCACCCCDNALQNILSPSCPLAYTLTVGSIGSSYLLDADRPLIPYKEPEHCILHNPTGGRRWQTRSGR